MSKILPDNFPDDPAFPNQAYATEDVFELIRAAWVLVESSRYMFDGFYAIKDKEQDAVIAALDKLEQTAK